MRVPEGWKIKKLEDICSINPRKPIAREDDLVSFISMDMVSEDARQMDHDIRKYKEVEKGFSSFIDNDVLVAKITPCFENGKGALVHQLSNGIGFGSTEFHVLRVKQNHHSKFIYYITNSYEFRVRGERNMQGSAGQKRVTTDYLKKYRLRVPPCIEQQKIVQILSTWDQAISTTEELLANSQQQKKALMQQLLTGKKRLLDEKGSEFRGEWRFFNFEQVFNVSNKKAAQVKASDILESGTMPVIDQGQKFIAGYTNQKEIYTDLPVVVFGDHTRCVKWIDFEFCPGADGTQVLQPKLHGKFCYYLLQNTDVPNLGYSRHMRELKEKDFKLPLESKEQEKIASVLTIADAEITALEQKIEQLKKEKKALMQQLLTGKKRVKFKEAN